MHFELTFVTSLVAQMVKRLPTMRETGVQSLGQEDLLEKAMAPHSSTLAWKIPWTEKPGGLQSMGVAKSRTRLSNFTFTFTLCISFIQFHSFACGCPVLPTSFVEETILSSLCILGSLVVSQLTTSVRVYFWAPCSVP